MSDDLDFHYKREERLSMRSAPRRVPAGGGSLRFNRGRGILLFNLVLVVLLFAVYTRVLARADRVADFAGCRLALRAMAAGDDVLALLEVSAGAKAPSGERVFVVFRAGDADLRLSELLPQPGGSLALSGRLPDDARAREITAEVSAAGRTVLLRRAVDRGKGRGAPGVD